MKPSLLALTVMLALTSISAAYASDAPNFSALLEQSRAQAVYIHGVFRNKMNYVSH